MAYKIKIEKQGEPYPYNHKDYKGSLQPDPEISTKIKPIDRDEANAELEKGEVVLDPETGALHKVLGKPHSKGGTPLFLKDNAFVFSNYKSLAIKKDEKELFEFKLGGKYKEKNNTPSKILEKEVDFKHHNKMIDILNNDKDNTEESVNSAKLMLLKNLEKAGQIAFLQESKKNNPTPAFAQNTAPIYSQDIDNKITESMQYMQKGGSYLPKYQFGAIRYGVQKKPEGYLGTDYTGYGPNGKYYINGVPSNTPQQQAALGQIGANPQRQDRYIGKLPPYPDQWTNYYDKSQKTQYTAPDWINPTEFYNTPGLVDYMKTLDKTTGVDWDMNKADDSVWGWRHEAARQKFYPNNNFNQRVKIPNELQQKLVRPPFDPTITAKIKSPIGFGNNPGNQSGIVDRTTYDTELTPWQKINIGIPFYRALNVKTQYPLRQHQESFIPQVDNINVQPQLDANNQAYFNAAGLSGDTAYQQQLYGNRIAANNQAIGRVQQDNVQLQNQQKMMAANSLNQDAAMNRQYDLRYYDQVQTAVKNRDELRQAYTQQGINNLNDTMTKKLAFDSWLNSQQQFRGNPTYVDSDGVQHYQGQTLYSPKTGFWGNSVQYNSPNIDWSTYQSSVNNRVDSPEEIQQAYERFRQIDPNFKLADFFKNRNFMQYMMTNPSGLPPGKLGGKFRIKKLK